MKGVLVYSPGYDLSLPGLDWLHPFHGRKFSAAWQVLRDALGDALDQHWIEPKAPVDDVALLRVHTADYLASLSSSAVVAKALEIQTLRLVPAGLIRRRLLEPMRLAVAGTILAVEQALDGAVAMNLGGGYHHAFADHGEGFCLYADVAVAIAAARAAGTLTLSDPIAIIDLDAHRGNGVWQLCGGDPAVQVLDVYNFQIYPGLPPGAFEDYPFQVPLKSGTRSAAYLEALGEELPRFLASMPAPRLAIYNAGTDIVEGDPLGRLAVSPEAVAERDRLVLDSLVQRGIPTAIVTSGGYTARSAALIAKLAQRVVEQDRA